MRLQSSNDSYNCGGWIILQDLLNERVAESYAYDPQDFTLHLLQKPLRVSSISGICRSTITCEIDQSLSNTSMKAIFNCLIQLISCYRLFSSWRNTIRFYLTFVLIRMEFFKANNVVGKHEKYTVIGDSKVTVYYSL